MKRSFVQLDGKLYEKGVDEMPRLVADVIPDIEPYQSQITGEWITSRSQHREHLAKHGYVEVGNDSSLYKQHQGIPDVSPQKRKELIRSQIDRIPEKDFRAMHKRFLDNWKWNSRER